jgi:hypothetical protein
MRTLATALFLISVIFVAGLQLPVSSQTVSTRFMAFCADGDGAISDWLNTRYEAYLIGREHERAGQSHRFEIWVQQGETAPAREPSCALIADGSKPDTLKVQNTCGRCVKFFVTRTTADGEVKSKEFTIKPNKSRHFRKLPGAKISVDSERDCPE